MSGVLASTVAKDETMAMQDSDGRRYWKVYFADNVYTAQVRVHVIAEDKSSTDYFVTLSIKDISAPSLAKVSSARVSEAGASAVFKSDEQGSYYYAVAKKGKKQPAIDTSGEGFKMLAGTTTVTLSGLKAGAYVLYIIAKDLDGNLSDVLAIPIPKHKKKKSKDSNTSAAAGKSGSGGKAQTSGGAQKTSRPSSSVAATSVKPTKTSGTAAKVRHSAKSRADDAATALTPANAANAQTGTDILGTDAKSPGDTLADAWEWLAELPLYTKALLILAGLGLLYLLFWLVSALKRKRERDAALATGTYHL